MLYKGQIFLWMWLTLKIPSVDQIDPQFVSKETLREPFPKILKIFAKTPTDIESFLRPLEILRETKICRREDAEALTLMLRNTHSSWRCRSEIRDTLTDDNSKTQRDEVDRVRVTGLWVSVWVSVGASVSEQSVVSVSVRQAFECVSGVREGVYSETLTQIRSRESLSERVQVLGDSNCC